MAIEFLSGINLAGDLELKKTDPKIILFDDSGANGTPNGEIVFSEVDGYENFNLRYNGLNDRFEYWGLISNTSTLVGYWNRSTDTSLHSVGTISTGSDGDSTDWKTAYDHSQATHAPTDAEANVQADWTATSGDALILNKPTTFAPSAHNHDDRYYTETETNLHRSKFIGWEPAYGSSSPYNVKWNVTENAIQIQSDTDTSTGAAYKAQRVIAGEVITITLMAKASTAAGAGLYVRLYQYNGDLPDGKTHVSNNADSSTAVVQEDSSSITSWVENVAVTTDWVTYEKEVAITTDGYVSVVVLNWTGIGTNTLYITTPDIQTTKAADSDLLDGQEGTHYLDYDNFSNTPTLPTSYAPTDAEANVQADWTETTDTSDAFILNKPTTFAPSAHNHTSLTGVTALTFAAQSSDSASITTTIDGTHTYFNFNLTDDNNNDWWRWRFTPSGSTVYDAMVLKPATNGNANLIVSGNVTADNIPTSYAPTDAEANVQADWTETTTTSDAFILNKPTTFPPSAHNHDDRYYTETEIDAQNVTLNETLAALRGWVPGFSNDDDSSLTWDRTEDALKINSSTDTSIGAVYKAMRVKDGQTIRVTVTIKGNVAGADGLYLRLQKHDGDLPDGKTHISHDASNSSAFVQEDDSEVLTWHENGAISTDWVTHEKDVTITADGYISFLVLNWTGNGTDSVWVKTPDIQINTIDFVSAASGGTFGGAVTVTGELEATSLDINGSGNISGNLFLGTTGTENFIAFKGTTGDSTAGYTTTFIGEYLYGGSEQSELILYKGNDGHASTAAPDRIRMIGANLCFDVYDVAQSYPTTMEGVAGLTTIRALTIDQTKLATFAGSVQITGSLTVNGTTTTINTATVEVEDNILQLNTTQGTPDTATAETSGISIYRGVDENDVAITEASLIFDDADDTWDLTNNLTVAGNVTGSNLSGTNTGDQDLSTYSLKSWDSTADLTNPSASTGTWTNGTATDWGTPKIGTSLARFNDGTGTLSFTVPTGMKTAYISQLTWSSGGYMDVYGVQSDGDEVFLRRVNTKQTVENTNEGDPNQHDGTTIAFAGHIGDFPTIMLHNKAGRFHLTGLGFSKSELAASDGTGIVHYSQLVNTPTIPTDFVSAANGGTFSGNIAASNLSGTNTGDNAANTNSTLFIDRGDLDLTSATGGNNGLPFDNAHTETKISENGMRTLSYTGASAFMFTFANGGSAGVVQYGAHYNGNDFYMRTRIDGSNWQDWRKLYHDNNIPTWNQNTTGNAATVTTNANLTGGVTSVGNAATVVTNANLTGHITSVGNATSLASFTTAELNAAISDGAIPTDFVSAASGGTFGGDISVQGNILLTGDATTTNQGRLIDFTGFDKEGVTDFSDRATIAHTTNVGGHTGSVLVITSQNDADDGIAFTTNASSNLKHNGNIIWTAGNDGPTSGLAAETAATAAACTGNAATVTTNANLTGHITSNGNAAVLGSFTTAQLSAALSDSAITTNPTINTIPLRNANGDIAAREIILSSGLSAQIPTVLVSMYPSTNQLVRTTPAAVAASLPGAFNSSSVTSATTTTTVVNVAHASYTAAFFDFVIKNGTNVRAGTVYACHNGASTPLVEFTETSTVDLGDTSDVTLSVDISGTNMRLRATTTSSTWTIKSLTRLI